MDNVIVVRENYNYIWLAKNLISYDYIAKGKKRYPWVSMDLTFKRV